MYKGFCVINGSLYGKSDCYRSGSIKERAEEFNALLHNDEVDIIMAAIGCMVELDAGAKTVVLLENGVV